VPHDHTARVAREALRRLRGNVAHLFEHGLAGLRRVREHRRIDMDHNLVPLTRRSRVERVMQRRLAQQGQRVHVLLAPGGRLHRRIGGAERLAGVSRPLMERLEGGIEGAPQEGAYFWSQPRMDHHGAVLFLREPQRSARMLTSGLACLGPPIHATPGADDLLDVGGGAGAPTFTSRASVPGVATRVSARTSA
jgi:hypothetical protein